MQRRSFLRISGLAGLMGTLPWCRAPAWGAEYLKPTFSPSAEKSKKCILVWLDGGPSHLEMFDPKPNASTEVRGPLGTIPTGIAGIRFSECLPGLSKRSDRLAVIRSMTSPLGEHNLGTHYLMSGFKPTPATQYPAFGTVFTFLQKSRVSLPSNIAIPNHRVGGSNYSPAGFLGNSQRPFELGGDPANADFKVSDLSWYPSLDAKRVKRRESMLNGIEQLANQAPEKIDPQFEQAFRLLQDRSAKNAFDLTAEKPATRQKYGSRSIGQSCLLARRLVEKGVQFVTINYRGWDTHDQMVTRLKDGYNGAKKPVGLIPSLDLALSSLMDDLQDRGLWNDTLIVVMGEFGRTPKLNVNQGRDHWPRAFSVMLSGGLIRGGSIYGKTDEKGESPSQDPVSPAKLITTIYKALDVDISQKLTTPDGRPIAISGGESPISELLNQA